MTRAYVFDAYGTLFDVTGAARIAAREHSAEGWADHWAAIAADWRTKQLEYSWLRAAAGQYVDFWQVTQDALDWALDRQGLADADLRARLLQLYWELPAYPEVPGVLAALAERGAQVAVLSNGAPQMLAAAARSAGIDVALISVDEARTFKPAPAVYDLVETHLGVPPCQVSFVSANGWDICAAAGYGFHTIWVNRAGAPVDRLWAAPKREVRDLNGVL